MGMSVNIEMQNTRYFSYENKNRFETAGRKINFLQFTNQLKSKNWETFLKKKEWDSIFQHLVWIFIARIDCKNVVIF